MEATAGVQPLQSMSSVKDKQSQTLVKVVRTNVNQ